VVWDKRADISSGQSRRDRESRVCKDRPDKSIPNQLRFMPLYPSVRAGSGVDVCLSTDQPLLLLSFVVGGQLDRSCSTRINTFDKYVRLRDLQPGRLYSPIWRNHSIGKDSLQNLWRSLVTSNYIPDLVQWMYVPSASPSLTQETTRTNSSQNSNLRQRMAHRLLQNPQSFHLLHHHSRPLRKLSILFSLQYFSISLP
jgi:hypothetical protein